MMIKHASTLALLIGLGGCSLAPDFTLPGFPVPSHYPDGPAYDRALTTLPESDDIAHLSNIAWPAYFQDPALKELIQQGLAHNRSLKQAALDIAAARTEYGIERSGYFPEITTSGSMTRQKFPFGNFGQPGQPANDVGDNNESEDGTDSSAEATGASGAKPVTFYNANLGITAYELDLFGRVQSLNDAALNRFFASEAAQRSIRVALIADIASAYTTLKANQALLRLAESTIAAQDESLRLIQLRVEAGIANQLDLRQAQILLEQARADRVALERALAQNRNALRLLLGTPPELDELADEPSMVLLDRIAPTVPVGLPSEVLTTRPDIQQAEHLLRAANANIGAARAAFFPQITLTASGGYLSTELDDLFSTHNQFWQFSPSISLPIFTAGRLSNNLELAEIRTDQAVLSYEQAIETAFREVADTLAAVSTYDDQMHAQKRLIDASLDATRLSELRYDEGVENYLSVLDARRELYSAQQAYLRLKAEEVSARIALYKAVGGARDPLSVPINDPAANKPVS